MLEYEEFKKKYKENMSGYGDLIETSEIELVKLYIASVTLLMEYNDKYVDKLVKEITKSI